MNYEDLTDDITAKTQTKAARLRVNFDQDTFLFNSNATQRVVTTIQF